MNQEILFNTVFDAQHLYMFCRFPPCFLDLRQDLWQFQGLQGDLLVHNGALVACEKSQRWERAVSLDFRGPVRGLQPRVLKRDFADVFLKSDIEFMFLLPREFVFLICLNKMKP